MCHIHLRAHIHLVFKAALADAQRLTRNVLYMKLRRSELLGELLVDDALAVGGELGLRGGVPPGRDGASQWRPGYSSCEGEGEHIDEGREPRTQLEHARGRARSEARILSSRPAETQPAMRVPGPGHPSVLPCLGLPPAHVYALTPTSPTVEKLFF